MAKTATPKVAESAFDTVIAAAQNGQTQMARYGSQGCELYARYFASLAKAGDPEDLTAANADLMLGGLDAVVRRTTVLPSVDRTPRRPLDADQFRARGPA